MSFFLLYFCLITTHYGSLFRSEIFFRTTQELEYLFFCRAKHGIFFQNLTFGYMTKTLNHIFFFLHQNQNIFFINIVNQNIFFRKKHNPLMEVKWSVPKNKMNSYFAYLQITMISMLEYLFSRRIMTDFSYFPFYGTRIIILLYLCYAYAKSYTYLFKYM